VTPLKMASAGGARNGQSSFRHWKVGAGVPLADTLKVTVAPAATVWLAGWLVMAMCFRRRPP
jgi:hypothetical protein